MPAPATATKETLTKREVCALLGKSPRTIDTYMRDGRLPAVYVKGPNGNETRFDPDDVHRLKRDLETPTPKPVTGGALSAVPAIAASLARPDGAIALQPIVAQIADALRPREPKPWLTLAEAAEFSGLPKSWLLREARAGSPLARNVSGGVDAMAAAAYRFSREALAR
jgi:predicted DNA-binding transcriptional regulator AlpA